MAVTATDIARVRALCDVAVSDFSDAAITAIIELYPKIDSSGYQPTEDDWTETYDLYLAAADVLDQRAVQVITQYNVTADGATLNRSQMQAQLISLAAYYRSQSTVILGQRPILETYDLSGDDEDEDEDE